MADTPIACHCGHRGYVHELGNWGCTAAGCPCTTYRINTVPDPDLPVLPYAGSSGHSGSSTSAERAAVRDGDGTTRSLQERTLHALQVAGPDGMTVVEARRSIESHHGSMSGALTDLHKAGRIERLAERREKAEVYVLPEFVEGRQIAVERKDLRRLEPYEKDALEALEAERDHVPDGYAYVSSHDLDAVLQALRRMARR